GARRRGGWSEVSALVQARCASRSPAAGRAALRSRTRRGARMARLLQRGRRPQPERVAHLDLEIVERGRVLLQPLLGVLTPMPDALVLERVPGARLLDEALLDGGVEDGAGLGDALAVEDVELRLAERRRQLVLDDLHLRTHADRLRAVLDRLLPPDVQTDRRIELQRAPTRGRLWRSKPDPDFFADLVDEDHDGAGAGDGGGELAEGLRHEARLQAGQRVAHVAVELGAR